MGRKKGIVNVATCQFGITTNVRKNSEIIQRQIIQAKAKGADLAHFPETAVTGYPFGRSKFTGFDWDLIQEETRTIMKLAKKERIWVALGSAHQLTGKRMPHNCLYVINSSGKIVERYDKCFGTGAHLTTFKVNGVCFGIIICYDTWFVELYREYKKLGVDCILHSIYSNYRDFSDRTNKENTEDTSFPQTHARVNRFWISSSNYADKYQDATSTWTEPNGHVTSLSFKRASVMVNEIDLTANHWDPSSPYRDLALKGILTNGKKNRDPRSTDRTIL
ncbi:MAG: carbon-nitrogen hydrolase family protein [Lentisphaeria bacterium]|nr:carbon-nitrogen hydrolase family protein [Lentisphaeria bacterium]